MLAQPRQHAAPPDRPDRPKAGAGSWRNEPVVGHRLANGYMAVHALGQPCRYCDGEAALEGEAAGADRS